jgi:alpha-mannosidase
MAFPFKADSPQVRFEGANSVIEPTVDQLPGSNTDYYAAHHWADVSDGDGGVTWAPIDTHMVEFGGLWGGSMSAAHHGATGPEYGHDWLKPGEITKGHIYSFIAYNNFRTNFINVRAGDVLSRYALTSHEGDWQSANASAFGWSAANPPVSVWMNGPKSGPLPTTGSFASVDGDHAQLTTIKHSEDGQAVVLRLVETLGVGGRTSVHLPHLTIHTANLTDAVELNPVPILDFDAHRVTVDLVPFGSATIYIRHKDQAN